MLEMSKYSKRALLRNHHPDLFDWYREHELRRTNPAARYLAERFNLPLYRAITIAHLAGIGSEAVR
jgi:hypothetical protein